MSDEKPLNDAAIKIFIKSEIEKSGYSLQSKVEDKLKQDFTVTREQPFLDRDEGKGRFIDLMAHTMVPSLSNFKEEERKVIAQFFLTIECKSIPGNAWVFFPDEHPFVEFPDYYSLYPELKPDPFAKYIYPHTFREIPYASSYSEFMFDKNRSNKKTDNLYDAINVVTKANKYEMDTTSRLYDKLYFGVKIKLTRIVALAVFQPLIVFTGKMYMASTASGGIDLKPIQYVQLPKSYVSQNYDETLGTIDVVSYDALIQYVSLLKKYPFARANEMLKDQDNLKTLTANIGA